MLSLIVLAILGIFGVSASLQVSSGESPSVYRHRRIRYRSQEGMLRNSTVDLQKRGRNSRFTFYQTGLGACGAYSQPTEHVRYCIPPLSK